MRFRTPLLIVLIMQVCGVPSAVAGVKLLAMGGSRREHWLWSTVGVGAQCAKASPPSWRNAQLSGAVAIAGTMAL